MLNPLITVSDGSIIPYHSLGKLNVPTCTKERDWINSIFSSSQKIHQRFGVILPLTVGLTLV